MFPRTERDKVRDVSILVVLPPLAFVRYTPVRYEFHPLPIPALSGNIIFSWMVPSIYSIRHIKTIVKALKWPQRDVRTDSSQTVCDQKPPDGKRNRNPRLRWSPFLWLDHSGRYLNNHAQSGGRYKNDFVYPEQSFWFVQVLNDFQFRWLNKYYRYEFDISIMLYFQPSKIKVA